MKNLFIIILFIFSINLHAQELDKDLINLELQDAKLSEVLTMILSNVLQKEFILEPELLRDTTPITMSLKNKSHLQVKELYQHLLSENNIYTKEVGGVIYLSKRKTSLYQPDQHQDVISTKLNTFQYSEKIETDSININHIQQLQQSVKDLQIYKPANISSTELLKILQFAGIKATVSNDHIIYENVENSAKFIQALLKQFDSYNSDIVVKATVIEYQQSDKTTTALQAVFDIIKDTVTFATPISTVLSSQLTLSLSALNLNAVLKNIASNDNFNVLTSPTLRVSNNHKSVINIGNDVPVLTSLTQTSQGQPLQNVEYRSSGIILEVTPRIYTDIIELDLLQNISDFVQTTNGVNSTPTLSQRKLQTTLKIKSGETILIGGLTNTRHDDSKTSFFGFKTGSSNNNQQTDILLVLNVEKI